MFSQLIVNGLVLGSGFALIAIGHTIIFGLMKVANFAHGELYLLGAFFAYTFISLLGLPFWLGFILVMISGAILGWLLNVLIFRYVRDDMTVNGLVTIGLSIFVINFARYLWGPEPKMLPNPFPVDPLIIGKVAVTPVRLFIILASIAAIAALQQLIKRTSIGRAFRATFQNRDAAQLVGINIEKIYTLSSVIGTVMATLAGTLLGLVYTIDPNMGLKAISVAWAVVVTGGLGSFTGAIVIGYFLGLMESLGGGYISSEYKDAFAFIMLVLVLIFKPHGIFTSSSGKMSG
ncbi:branched-chain amino acid ABC transporter permease [Candidatus Formimonas warabiya]|uniref:Branched-chain amino acid ABC transporter permease n=1 Tax=Formimonas warabiya TaxID=1761012 RepID=A0A3G1KQ50_FORW1|nr:branched-chain amino acid ABC transporter permease [Candidatus Formimonas warabiya]ATW24603.1 hypothetical protein DCMF_07225 [Candidatus Formimonas warabiya]